MTLLTLLHLCDSLFPIGGFAYSDGLEAAERVREVPIHADTADVHGSALDALRDWLDVCLDETFARLEGPAVRQAWEALDAGDWETLSSLDREVIALRPSSSARRSSRAMGRRLVTTWCALHPNPRLEHTLALARAGTLAPTLPVAFGVVCAAAAIDRRHAVAGYAYTRLAATASAAMRLMPIGQIGAHRLLARALERVPPLVDAIEASAAPLECFSPAMDIAAMTQQYLESRLFRS